MKYTFRDGFRNRAVSAQTAHAEMERLRADGDLTASGLFEAARPKDAALHGEFTWNGTEAVKELGLIRARSLLRAVVVLDDALPAAPSQRVYVHVPSDTPRPAEGVYVPLTMVVQQPDQYERAFEELRRKFGAAETALHELEQAAKASPQPDRLAAIGLAVQGFGAVREALALLRA